MEELKHSKIELVSFRNLLTMTGIFIDDIRVLDKILISSDGLKSMDFSNIKDEEGLCDIYDKIYESTKKYSLEILKKEE